MILRLLVCAMLLAPTAGCSVYMAASGEEKRDLGVLTPGTHRDVVVSEFGMPVASVNEMSPIEGGGTELRRYDVFSFTQGRSGASNAGRAIFYGAAAVFTLGLSEVIMTPAEMLVGDQGKLRLRTHYDINWKLATAELQDGSDWVSIPEFQARAAARQQQLEADKAAGTN